MIWKLHENFIGTFRLKFPLMHICKCLKKKKHKGYHKDNAHKNLIMEFIQCGQRLQVLLKWWGDCVIHLNKNENEYMEKYIIIPPFLGET